MNCSEVEQLRIEIENYYWKLSDLFSYVQILNYMLKTYIEGDNNFIECDERLTRFAIFNMADLISKNTIDLDQEFIKIQRKF